MLPSFVNCDSEGQAASSGDVDRSDERNKMKNVLDVCGGRVLILNFETASRRRLNNKKKTLPSSAAIASTTERRKLASYDLIVQEGKDDVVCLQIVITSFFRS